MINCFIFTPWLRLKKNPPEAGFFKSYFKLTRYICVLKLPIIIDNAMFTNFIAVLLITTDASYKR
tara:strand:- start:1408 stop:1602 length:195 start_codon:yes stop_codon:yes gene_type:complete